MHEYDLDAMPVALLVSLALCLLLFHILFIRFLRLNKKTWKKIDYLWLGVGALGLVVGASNHRYEVARTNAEYARRVAVEAYNGLKANLLTAQRDCGPLGSAPGSDSANPEHKTFCEFVRQDLAAMDGMIPDEPLPIDIEFPMLQDKELQAAIANLWLNHADFERMRSSLVQQRIEAKPSWLDEVRPWLSPILFIIALGLRITKVTADLEGDSVEMRASVDAPKPS